MLVAIVVGVEGGKSNPLDRVRTQKRPQVEAVAAAAGGGDMHLPHVSTAPLGETVHALMTPLVETSRVVVVRSMEACQAHLLSPFQSLAGSGWCGLLCYRLLRIAMTSVGRSMKNLTEIFSVHQCAKTT